MASLITQASVTELCFVITSPLIVTLFTVKHSNKLNLFNPSKWDTVKKKKRYYSVGKIIKKKLTLRKPMKILPRCNGAKSIILLLLSVLSSETTSLNSISPRCKIEAKILYTQMISSSLNPINLKALLISSNFKMLY